MSVGTLSKLDDTGDTELKWDSSVDAEVATARDTFDRLVGENKYRAYKVDPDGEKEIIHSFDPAAEHIVLAPQTVGG